MKLDKNIKLILDTLQKNGQGYIVGGYVRDILLGVEPKDCDFVTDIDYERLLEIFKDYSPKEIGRHFGIIQIKIDNIHYEIAKMRQDKGIPEDRKAQEIEFTQNIYEDLKRRDFTINAIAYDGEKFYYGDRNSQKDIESKTLRFVGDCRRRIEEDPLRILRYFRFLATKELKVLDENVEEISNYRELLQNLSAERIREEFNKIIIGRNAYDVLKLLSEKKILEVIIPEWRACRGFNQKNIYHLYTVDEHILQALKETEKDLIVRLAILFHDIGKPKCFSVDEKGIGHFYRHEIVSAEMSREIMMRLRYDKNSIERVYNLIKFHILHRIKNEKNFIKKMMNRLGKEDMERYFQVLRADRKAHQPPYDFSQIEEMERSFQEIVEKQLPISLKDLDIKGKDLIEIGVEQGKIIGEILTYLLNQVLEYPEYNTKEKLLELALKYRRSRRDERDS